MPETANVSLEEIDAVFRSSAGGEDAALKRQVRLTLYPLFFPSALALLVANFIILFTDRGRTRVNGSGARARHCWIRDR